MKKFLSFQKEFNESSAYGRISSRFKTLSGRSLDAAAKEHGDEAKKLQKEIEAQQKEIDRRKAAMKQEEVHISEATVKTQKYSWGTMKTVHHGSDFSIPLHPEHHQAIAKLKDEQEHKFKDETGRHWTARRKGDEVHFQGANNGRSTKVKHSDLKEEIEQVEEKLDMAKAKMGDVIKDFQKSDAPQFAGKSKEKRREMAIAAKLGAERDMKEDTNKDGKTMLRFKDIAEQLKGKQHKIDVDKDGKIEAEDLAKLRAKKMKEELELDELNKSTLASYAKKASKDARIKSMVSKDLEHRSETSRKDSNKTSFSNAATDWKKKAWKREAGVNKAVDRLTKEEVAKATGDLKDACWKGYTAVGMKMKNGKKVPNCVPVKEGVFGALAGGVLGGLAGGPLGAAAGAYLGHKAQQAGNNAKEVNKKLKKEEVEQIDELSFNTLASYASKVDQKDKQPLSKKRQAGYNSAAERMSQKAQTADLKKWGKISDSVEYNFDNEGNLMPNPVSFKQFLGQLDEIKMADLPSRKVSGRGYGTEYYKKEAEKDKSGYDDEKKEKSEVKRGRGRPVGSTSGARQKGSTTGKKRSGVEMTGYPLHLPNKN